MKVVWLRPALLLPLFLASACDYVTTTDTNDKSAQMANPTQSLGTSGTSTSGSNTQAPQGYLSQVALDTGVVTGWAQDADSPRSSIYVDLYADGPLGSGTFVTSVLANQQHNILPVGSYAFSFTLPAGLQDGKLHQLYAYGIDPANSQRTQLSNSPFVFNVNNQLGLAYFNSTVRPAMTARCTSCHLLSDYYSYKSMILSPSPFVNGTATNNILITTATGGNAHGGGNVRGNAASTPCDVIQTWWAKETVH